MLMSTNKHEGRKLQLSIRIDLPLHRVCRLRVTTIIIIACSHFAIETATFPFGVFFQAMWQIAPESVFVKKSKPIGFDTPSTSKPVGFDYQKSSRFKTYTHRCYPSACTFSRQNKP